MPEGSDRADRAEGWLLEEHIATLSKKVRIQYMLIEARKRNTWLTVRHLDHVASRSHIYGLLTQFKLKGWVVSCQIPVRMIVAGVKRLTRLTGWRASDAFLSLVSSQEEGPLSRYTQARAKRQPKADREGRKLTVLTRPASEVIGIDYAYTENVKVWVQMDPAVAEAIRHKMSPPTTEDPAEQYSLETEAFTLTLSRKDKARFDLYTLTWADALAQLCVISGISKRATKSLIAMVNHNIPEGYAKVEFPLFLQQLVDLEVEYKMVTRILDEKGKSIGWVIESNINRSMTIDYEVLGKVYAVDSFLSVMSAMQQQAAVNYASIKHKMLQEAEERERERKKAEEAMAYCLCDLPKPIMVAGQVICQTCGKPLTEEQLKRSEDDRWKNNLI